MYDKFERGEVNTVKRIWHFIFGLWIIVTVGVLVFLYIDYEDFKPYQDDLTAYSWFDTALYITAGLLMLVGLIIFFMAFKRSYKSRQLVVSYPDGELTINKKSIEKNILHTLRNYDNVRQPSVDVKLFQKKQSSYVDVAVDVFVTQTPNIQSYLAQLREDIKANVESFAELPVREVTVSLLDQKTLKKRVL